MTKNLLKISIVTSLALAASLGLAANKSEENTAVPGADHGGLYLGAAAGWGAIVVGSQNNYSSKNSGFVWRLNAGYLIPLTENISLGADLSYNKYNQTQVNKEEIHIVNINASSIDLTAVGKVFLSDWSLSARAGIASVMQGADWADGGSKRKTTYSPVIGAGIGYAVNKSLTITLDAQYLLGQSDLNDGDSRLSSGLENPLYGVLLGVTYNIIPVSIKE